MHMTPIAIFAYKRPDHLRKVCEALSRSRGFAESPTYFFLDGARTKEDQPLVEATRAVARQFAKEWHAEINFASTNRGLRRSILDGVSAVLTVHDTVIVVEDDLLVAPNALIYLNKALAKFHNAPTVMQVSAFSYPVDPANDGAEAYFVPFTTSWGWATWKRAWIPFVEAISTGSNLVPPLERVSAFNLGGAVDYLSMLKAQSAGRVDSWAIQWYAWVFKNQGMTLMPPRSFVANIGFDGSGTHRSTLAQMFTRNQDVQDPGVPTFPNDVQVDAEKTALIQHHLHTAQPAIYRALRKIKRAITLRHL
jgi:hypothetical protein